MDLVNRMVLLFGVFSCLEYVLEGAGNILYLEAGDTQFQKQLGRRTREIGKKEEG